MPLFGQDTTKFGRNQDVNLRELAEVDFPVHAHVDVTPVAEIKRQASLQHASQGDSQIRRGWMGLLTKLVREREEFMRADPPVEDGPYKISNDLFSV
jgi:hypothetical protein